VINNSNFNPKALEGFETPQHLKYSLIITLSKINNEFMKIMFLEGGLQKLFSTFDIAMCLNLVSNNNIYETKLKKLGFLSSKHQTNIICFN
jgi:hypothetical protein